MDRQPKTASREARRCVRSTVMSEVLGLPREALDRARRSRDPRFDGKFFIAVLSSVPALPPGSRAGFCGLDWDFRGGPPSAAIDSGWSARYRVGGGSGHAPR